MNFKPLIILMLAFSIACNNDATSIKQKNTGNIAVPISNPQNPYEHIGDIPLPEGYKRFENESSTFANWLQNVGLKKDKTVYLFDGRQKKDQSAQFAVLNFSVGNKDLQQCADAVMRLRAEYLFAEKRFDEINFQDNDHTNYHFTQPYNREHFSHFMEQVFGMCGSASLSKQLKPTDFSNIEAGDVIIRGGFPGHAVMVVDVAQNSSGKKIYLIAQSYMPAQDIHVLQNPNSVTLSPWYEVNADTDIPTPEYLFHTDELKKW